MPTATLGDARIRYDDTGEGPAVLCLAPGGLSASRAEVWGRAPWDPREALAGTHRVVAMDQRNTGTSWGPIDAGAGWGAYLADQLALMDHLGIERFAVVGMCIGGAFIASLLTEAPGRASAAVAMQPIGADGNQATFLALFDDWRAGVEADHPEADEAAWAGLRQALFGTERLVWSADVAALSRVACPLLVLQGDDQHHPTSVSQRMAATVPGAQLVERWKDPADLPAADGAIRAFLAEHWPGAAS